MKNKEKAAIVEALKDRYTLPILLEKLEIAKSSDYYQENHLNPIDKYQGLRNQISKLYYDNRACYGYRRIYAVLKRNGITISEKTVRQLMREQGLLPRIKQKQKYSSYKGEISPEVPNLIQRDFHAEYPNQKWLTDITEFAIPAGKVYLSPIVDCFDGMLPAWTIGTTPNAALVNEMFYKRTWEGVTLPEFMAILHDYLVWYNEKRIKATLGNMSPLEYRRSLGIAV